MLSFVKQVFIILLSFSTFYAAKCLFLNNEPWMVRPNFIDLNSVELQYYSFMVSLDKCSGSYNSINGFPKICIPSKTNDINIKIFDMISNRNEAKTMLKNISCHWKIKIQ